MPSLKLAKKVERLKNKKKLSKKEKLAYNQLKLVNSINNIIKIVVALLFKAFFFKISIILVI